MAIAEGASDDFPEPATSAAATQLVESAAKTSVLTMGC